MKNRKIFILFLLLTIFTVVLVACDNNTEKPPTAEKSDFEFILSQDGTYYSLASYDGNDSEISIPNEYQSKPVKEIKAGAFSNCESLVKISIPNSVISIGKGALKGCDHLQIITLPFVGENGEDNAFLGYIFGADTYESNDIYVPSNLTEVNITKASEIHDFSFRDCSSISTVTIGKGVNRIGHRAFENCTNLTEITIPEGVEEIGLYAFSDCKNLTNITLPNTITSIADFTFMDCENLISVDISDNVTNIGKNAFANCKNLTNITFPNQLTSIGEYAFYSCTNLSNINFPSSLTTIGKYAFRSCKNLNKIILPSNIIALEERTFAYCSNLNSVIINDNVSVINNWAFSDCENLESIVIGSSVTDIRYGAFSKTNLNSVFYKGSEIGWENITIDMDNSVLSKATIYYYSENQPTEEGNYWHYVNNIPTVW